MAEPKITIAVCTYKQEKEFKLCLESLLNQTYKDFIIEVYQDGPDNGRKKKIIDRYKDDRIRYFQSDVRENIYGGRYRHQSIMNCKTDFWASTNGDNIHSKYYLSNTIGLYGDINYDILKINVGMVDFIKDFYPKEIWLKHKWREKKAIELLKSGCVMVEPFLEYIPATKVYRDELNRIDCMSFIVKTEFIKQCGGWKYSNEPGKWTPDDWYTYSNMLIYKPHIKYINELLAIHR